MDLRSNKQLKQVREAFAILNKDGILSTDEDLTDYGENDVSTDDEEVGEEEEAIDSDQESLIVESEDIYRVPRLDMSMSGSGSNGAHELETTAQISEKSLYDAIEVDKLLDETLKETKATNDVLEEPSVTQPVPIETSIPSVPSLHDTSQKLPTIPSPPQFESYYEAYADQFMRFMDLSPTTYHVITHFKSLLSNNGFVEVKENESSQVTAPGLYFMTKDDLTLITFIIGGKWKPEHGSCFVGCHSDALSVKINPCGSKKSSNGFELLGVAPYSGSLNKLWLNRDLGLAGSVTVNENGKMKRKLIKSSYPIAHIPALAPHFGIDEPYNKQTQMVPIMSFNSEPLIPTEEELASPLYSKHSLQLLRYISELSSTSLLDIKELDLDLFDFQDSSRCGLKREFINSASLDDRLCSFDAIYGLLEFSQRFIHQDINDFDGFVGVFLANHEEIGSESRTGAKGGFLLDFFKSIVSSRKYRQPVEQIALLTQNSIFLSSDVTHVMNPNFKNVYLENNYPLPNVGPCIKFDSNGHVLSDSFAYVYLENIVDKLPGIKLQHFHIRNDSRSGGTIGPIMSGPRGINGAKMIIDVGMPILSMHSIRCSMGFKDVGMGVRFFKEVFQTSMSEQHMEC